MNSILFFLLLKLEETNQIVTSVFFSSHNVDRFTHNLLLIKFPGQLFCTHTKWCNINSQKPSLFLFCALCHFSISRSKKNKVNKMQWYWPLMHLQPIFFFILIEFAVVTKPSYIIRQIPVIDFLRSINTSW